MEFSQKNLRLELQYDSTPAYTLEEKGLNYLILRWKQLLQQDYSENPLSFHRFKLTED